METNKQTNRKTNKTNYSRFKIDSEDLTFHDQETSFQNYVTFVKGIIHRITHTKKDFLDTWNSVVS